jgi:glycosyltransferase involved in cell wall biosynthesis
MPSHDLAFEASRYAKQRGIPLLVDVRDQWPDVIVDALPRAISGAVRTALQYDDAMVRRTLRDATAVSSMLPSVLRWAQEKGARTNRDRDRVFYLGASAPATVLAPTNSLLSDVPFGQRPVVTFIGTFGRHYHPRILAEVARRMQDTNALFILGGDGEFAGSVRAACEGLENVLLPGWMDDADISWVLQRTTMAVIPSNTGAEALPNKFFTYLSGSIPIISSLGGDAKQLIESNAIGEFYPVNDVESLESHLRNSLWNKPLLERMKGNARNLFVQSLDSDGIYIQFADYLEELAASGAPLNY